MLKSLALFEGAPRPPELSLEILANDVFTRHPKLRIVVAVDELASRLLGCLSYFDNYSTWTGRSGIHICDLWVEPEARRRGIGTVLLGHVTSLHQSQRIDLFVLRDNEARKFYERFGFVEQREWCLYRRDTD
jgi:ribosomal protein S18 acetylase RimI-like enzyme